MIDLDRIANSDRFASSKQGAQAEMVLWGICRMSPDSAGASIQEVVEAFAGLAMAKPNSTRMKEHFKRSKNVRSVSSGICAATREFSFEMDKSFPSISVSAAEIFDIESITLPPFVAAERKRDLAKMVRIYGHLFLLENSMRGLVEKVLLDHLGSDWWETAANATMKRKHSERVANEQAKKWAPTRSEFGPLYALDWSDLITIMRKYPQQFSAYLNDIDFLHRYDDAGTFRNVVAHNGVLKESDDFERIRIYYRDWIKQLS